MRARLVKTSKDAKLKRIETTPMNMRSIRDNLWYSGVTGLAPYRRLTAVDAADVPTLGYTSFIVFLVLMIFGFLLHRVRRYRRRRTKDSMDEADELVDTRTNNSTVPPILVIASSAVGSDCA